MKKNFLFKGVSALGVMLLLATSVIPGLQYAYAIDADPQPETSELFWYYIHDEASWNLAFSVVDGPLQKYYDINQDEDRWCAPNEVSDEYHWGTCADKGGTLDGDVCNGGEWNNETCPHSWNGAINAPGAKYPWAVLDLPTPFNGTISFQYDGGDIKYPWGKHITREQGYGVASIPEELGNDGFLLDANGETTFDPNKLVVEITPETFRELTNSEWYYIHDEESWNAAYAEGGPLRKYYAANPSEDLWNKETNKAPGFNDKIYTVKQYTDASCEGEYVVKQYKAQWYSDNGVQKIIDVNDATIEYYIPTFFDTPTSIFELFAGAEGGYVATPEDLVYPCDKWIKVDSVSFGGDDIVHSWNGAINAPGAKYPWIAVNFTEATQFRIAFKYSDPKRFSEPWNWTKTSDWGVASVPVELGEEFLLNKDTGQTSFDTSKFDIILVTSEKDPINLIRANYTVTWENGNTVLETDELLYNSNPEYIGDVPTKAADSSCNAYKLEWSPVLASVTDDVTYSATFKCTSPKSSYSGGGGSSSSKKSETTKEDTKANTGDTAKVDDTKANENTNEENKNEGSNADGATASAEEFSQEFIDAYNFAHKNGITTKDSIEEAEMYAPLTRIAMAKMLSQYAINVLGKTPDTTKVVPTFPDVSAQLDADYDNGVTLAYQLGIMGIGIEEFRPFAEVTRAEFGTALSRMLFGTADGEGAEWYKTHLDKLMNEQIITNDNPNLKELRGYVMIMLMRSAQ